jgi:hypothetical protein
MLIFLWIVTSYLQIKIVSVNGVTKLRDQSGDPHFFLGNKGLPVKIFAKNATNASHIKL